jgi:hypothetical protein
VTDSGDFYTVLKTRNNIWPLIHINLVAGTKWLYMGVILTTNLQHNQPRLDWSTVQSNTYVKPKIPLPPCRFLRCWLDQQNSCVTSMRDDGTWDLWTWSEMHVADRFAVWLVQVSPVVASCTNIPRTRHFCNGAKWLQRFTIFKFVTWNCARLDHFVTSNSSNTKTKWPLLLSSLFLSHHLHAWSTGKQEVTED